MVKLAGLILAKKNSIRLPGKNLKDFGGDPMFIVNTKKCLRIFDEVYVSSDDVNILKLAEEVGAIPIERGEDLSGDVPNVAVYQHALAHMEDVDGIVAVQSCSPTIETNLIVLAKKLMETGLEEVMTCHPMEHGEDYHAQHNKVYGSVWAIATNRLKTYKNSYKPNPEALLVDTSIDIHEEKDYRTALLMS